MFLGVEETNSAPGAKAKARKTEKLEEKNLNKKLKAVPMKPTNTQQTHKKANMTQSDKNMLAL